MDRNLTSPRAPLGALVLAAALLALSGCQTAPTSSPEPTAAAVPRAKQVQALSSLGFVEEGDAWMLSLDAPLSFPVDSDQLTSDAREAVMKVAKGLAAAGLERVRVEGHTDSTGNRTYNLDLSRRRAAHVAELMTAAGFPAEGIDQRAFAAAYPLASNATAEGRARNRRVTITVVLQ